MPESQKSDALQRMLEDTGSILARKIQAIEDSQARVYKLLGIENDPNLSEYGKMRDKSLEEIVELGEELMNALEARNTSIISHRFLDNLLEKLENYFPYKPFYMRLLHIEFDELLDLPLEQNKAFQIIGILIIDVLDADNPYFENM